MAIVDINTIKEWYRNLKKPPQEHFWGWLDSFWHKLEQIPMASIQGLIAALQKKADLVNGVVPEEQLPFSVQTSEVLAIGEITATANSVNLAVHSSGKNKVRIKGKIYERSFPNSFNFTAVLEFTKILVLYAMPDSAIFYLAEGTEAQEAVEPELPENALIIRRIVVNLGGVTMDENSGGYKSTAEDNWRTVQLNSTAVKVISMGVTPASSFDIIPTIAGTKIGGIGCKMYLFLWDGKEWWFRNDSLFDVALEPTEIQNTYNFKATTFAESYLLKSKSWAKFKLKNGVLILVEFGGSANFPEGGNNGYVLEKDTAAEGGVKWSNSLHTEIATKQDKSLFSNLADKFLHYYDAATNKMISSGVKWISEGVAKFTKIGIGVENPIESLEISGRAKMDAAILNENNNSGTIDGRLRQNAGRLKFTPNGQSEKNVKFVEDGTALTLIARTIHNGNVVLFPTAINYSTGYVTVPNHGLSFGGIRDVGLFRRGINIDANGTAQITWAFPEEYCTTNTFLKVIDANTVMICNASQAVIAVNTSLNINVGNLDVTKWQLELFSEMNFTFPEISALRLYVGVYGCVGNKQSANRFYFVSNSDNSVIMKAQTGSPTPRTNGYFAWLFLTFFASGKVNNVFGQENYFNRAGLVNNYSNNFLTAFNGFEFGSLGTVVNKFYTGGNRYANGTIIEIYN